MQRQGVLLTLLYVIFQHLEQNHFIKAKDWNFFPWASWMQMAIASNGP